MNQRRVLFAWMTAMAMACGAAHAQGTDPAAPVPAPDAQTPARAAEPTLDELLGLPGDGSTKPNPAQGQTPDASRAELDRHLAPDQPEQDPFKLAVQLMDESAKRLEPASPDAGLDTQRIQEEVILRLDQLIAQAKKQRGQSKPKPQQQQQQQQNQNQNQQQDASSQRQQSKPQNQAAQDTHTGPAGQQAQTRTPPAGAGAAWGNLPDHVRDALLQGSSDRFSSAYEGLTQEYYKRLAQDPANRAGGAPQSPTPSPAAPSTAP